MNHEAFRSGNFDTKFVEKYFTPEALKPEPVEEEEILASLLASYVKDQAKSAQNKLETVIPTSRWKKNRV